MRKILSISLLIAAIAGTSFATTWTVDDDGNADFTTIQAAIDAASNGDEIIVMPGTYTGTGNWVIDLDGKAVWLHSSDGSASTFIDGEDARVGIFCNGGETNKTLIEGFTITNCSGNAGGGMWCWDSTPVLRDCRFVSNVAKVWGGGVACSSASPMFENCSFIGNSTVGAGGAFWCLEGNSVFTSCTFSDNSADNGGAISCHNSNLSFVDCSFTNNAAYDDGGAIQSVGNGFLLTTCTFANNTALSGGAIYNYINSNSIIKSCVFTGNSSTAIGFRGGGAVHNYDSDATLTDCTFKNNSADYGGGVWDFRSDTTVTNCLFQNNVASIGGGMYNNDNSPTLIGCTFNENTATLVGNSNGGGGMYFTESNAVIKNCSFFQNNAASQGGALFVMYECTVAISDCTQANNAATQGDGLYFANASLFVDGVNTMNEIYGINRARTSFAADTSCAVDGDFSLTPEGTVEFDINTIDADEMLLASGELVLRGALGVTNTSSSLYEATVGESIPIAQAGTVSGSFGSVTFPAMPSGLGLQLVERAALKGGDTELAVEVIEVEEANFATPFDGILQGPPIDVASFDANGDGKDEIVILYGGEQDSPGGIACYWVDEAGAPTLIQGYSSSVGNDPVDLDVGDLNGDGLDDVIVSNGMDKTISVLVTAIDNNNNLVFENEKVISLSRVSTCVAVIDWDGDTITNLDAVVGIDMDDSNSEDGYRVILDVSGDDSSGPWIGIPFYMGSGSSIPDPPTCVDGGSQKYAWGFVGGTRYGRMHHAESSSTLRVLGEIGSVVTTIEAIELDRDGGDMFIDILASSVEAKMVYLFQGTANEEDGFEDIIPIAANEPVEDVLAIDADHDGDMDIVMAAPTSANVPLTLLRNDGAIVLLGGALKGTTWSKQEMIGDEPVNNLTSGDLSGKDEDDDWLEGIGNTTTFTGNGTGTIAQTNLLGDVLPCAADINGDGVVDVADILAVIAAWGQSNSPADINGDGTVDVSDILELVANWGPCD